MKRSERIYAHNVRVKKYKNGTVQLTYYHDSILSGVGEYPAMDAEKQKEDNEKLLKLKKRMKNYREYIDNPFLNNISFENYLEGAAGHATKIGSLDIAQLFLDDEELQIRKNRSIANSLNRSKKMIYDYGRSNIWEWFLTFTFEPCENFDRMSYDQCRKKMSEWFHNVRKRMCPNIKYLVVPEMHESHAWHFHALVSDVDSCDIDGKHYDGLKFVEAVNNQEYLKDKRTGELMYYSNGMPRLNRHYKKPLKDKNGNQIYNIANFKSGFTTATKIIDTKKAVSYIVKYMTKDMTDILLGKHRYMPSQNLDKPYVESAYIDRSSFDDLIQYLQYTFKVRLSTDCIKTYDINVPGYSNMISVFEFNPDEERYEMDEILAANAEYGLDKKGIFCCD